MSDPADDSGDAELVVFLLDGQRYAVPLPRVDQVVRAVALTPFPKAPPVVAGVFDLHGELVPVMDLRRRFRLPERPLRASDQFLLVRTRERVVALAVDAVASVLAAGGSVVTEPGALVPGLEYLCGVTRLPEGIVLVHDIDAFLSLDEEAQLDAALTEGRP